MDELKENILNSLYTQRVMQTGKRSFQHDRYKLIGSLIIGSSVMSYTQTST